MHYSIGDDMIWVFDKNYDELISYSYGDFAWDSATPYVLSNGNILIEMTANVEEETKGAFYDPFYDEYHCFKQVLIDPAKGTVTDLDVTFWIDEMITPANDDEEIAIVGDCQIASVWKISEEGIISNDLSYLALDNEMKVKEELPAILENQCGLLGAIDSTTFIVPSAVEDPDYARFYENYKINTTDGKIELLEIDSDYFYDGHYQYVTGGVIINDVLYNEKNEEIVDLRYVYNYTVQGEDVIMVQEDENSRSTRFLWIENGAAVYSNYFDASQTRQPMLSGAFFTVQTFDEVTGDWIYNLYNRFGQKILSGDYISETWIGDERGIECMWYDDLGDLHYSYYIVK